ncbi:forkhead box protein R1 isoform X2 [Acinonyx jubatus]|uniref:Forkhead box protein R1 isoform X2 n=1 Tax=Acinonyx jubatus TaxID=32536 RepID=A0ABM3NKM3_ACIJB|nr:forkhead box protein R1 isoform X2 [Acinonyx jubatus]
MGNESFLAFTTAHLPLAEQNLARYRLRIVEPPKVPVGKTPNSDQDGPALEPNLWMWVNPNIVYPPGKLEVPEPHKGEDLPGALPSPQPAPKEEDFASCSEATAVESLPPSSPSSEQSPPQKRFASSPRNWELTEEEEAEDQDDSSSVALPSPHKRAPLQSRRFRQASSQEGRLWSRPPLNYFHLIALALRNSAPCGLNVQQIYSFTRFEKVPVSVQGGAGTRPRSCLWKLTEEGRRRFAEEARALASSRLESIQRCMSQPDVMPFLFDL